MAWDLELLCKWADLYQEYVEVEQLVKGSRERCAGERRVAAVRCDAFRYAEFNSPVAVLDEEYVGGGGRL